MLRVFSWKALRLVHKPGLRLSASRHVPSMHAPFTGPPSYGTTAQLLSSSRPDLPACRNRKRDQETRYRGWFSHIHEDANNPEDCDVLISDIKHVTLETAIAKDIGIPYLSKATEAEANEVVNVAIGYIRDGGGRTLVPFVVRHREEIR